MARDQLPNDGSRWRGSRDVYKERHFGQSGGYGQSGPGLNHGGDAERGEPYRTPPSDEFSGYHYGSYEARHYRGRSEREPLYEPRGTHQRFSEDRYDDDRINRALRDHRGKGPRGHVRRDERILQDVSDRLTFDDWLDASDVEINVSGGQVILSGSVDSREDKRRAEDLAYTVSGVSDVLNSLRIRTDRLGPVTGRGS